MDIQYNIEKAKESEEEVSTSNYATKEELDEIINEILIEYKKSLEKLKYV